MVLLPADTQTGSRFLHMVYHGKHQRPLKNTQISGLRISDTLYLKTSAFYGSFVELKLNWFKWLIVNMKWTQDISSSRRYLSLHKGSANLLMLFDKNQPSYFLAIPSLYNGKRENKIFQFEFHLCLHTH